MKIVRIYRWLLPANLFTCALLAGRIVYTLSISYVFIVWNLFLAFVPLLFAHWVDRVHGRSTQWGLFFLWLLFFPNSVYLITDLFHLHQSNAIPLWYDLMLLFTSAFNGLMMGLASFGQIERFLEKHIPIRYLQLIYFAIFLLCGYGVYLGRYQRLNSWDIFANPMAILLSVRYDISHPFANHQWWMISILIAIWLFIIRRYLYTIRSSGASSNSEERAF